MLSPPRGRRQQAPGWYDHQRRQSSRSTGPGVIVNTSAPGTSAPRSAPGKSRGSSSRSATVTWPVAFVNRRNSATVTGCASIQNPSTVTGRTGRSSG